MTCEKVDTFKYVVEPFDDDFTGRLSWNVLGKHVLACAERHAGARGFDRLTLDGHQRFLWVLSRMVFEMDEWPRLGDSYTISTWVRRCYRYFTDRYFDIANDEGHEKEKIIKYIKGQKTHHQHHNLQNELEELLDEFEIAYDNKFFLKD